MFHVGLLVCGPIFRPAVISIMGLEFRGEEVYRGGPDK